MAQPCVICSRTSHFVAGELFPLKIHECSHCSAIENKIIYICADCFFEEEHQASYAKFYKDKDIENGQ